MNVYRYILMLLMMAIAHCAVAQFTATNAFTNAPASIIPLLQRSTRLDMVDYFNSGSTTASTNLLNGKSKITALSDESISVSLSEASSLQMVILPMKTDSVIMIIETIAMPAHDSVVKFYTRQWTPIDETLFSPPVLNDWLTKDGRKQKEHVANKVKFMATGCVYNQDTQKLVIKNNILETLDKEDYNNFSQLFHPSLTYTWDGKKMKPSK